MSFARPITLTDGTKTTQIPVAENQNLILGIATSNRDPLIWGDDANEWKPERWLFRAEAKDDDLTTEWTTKVPQRASDAKLPGVYSGMFVNTLSSRIMAHLHPDRMSFLDPGAFFSFPLLRLTLYKISCTPRPHAPRHGTYVYSRPEYLHQVETAVG